VRALDGLTIEIPDHEIFVLLGPNGAGKTTAIHILCSILRPTSGSVVVEGIDVGSNSQAVREKLGIAFQEPVLDGRLTVEQNLKFHADACGISSEDASNRIEAVLRDLAIWENRKQKASKLSGGMKKKVENAKVFVQRPAIGIFDEPTAFLDVPSRHKVWELIDTMIENKASIVLATNLMDEAERLGNQVGILSKGKLVATGTPQGLKDSLPKGDVIEFQLCGDFEVVQRSIKGAIGDAEVVQVASSQKVRVYIDRAELKLPRVMEALIKAGCTIDSVHVKEPSLDDVFLHYTGGAL
jgi:ABC-2 type transport system ATP-binding protein